MTKDTKFNNAPNPQPEHNVPPTQELIILLSDNNFRNNYVKVQTESDQQLKQQVIGEMKQKVKKQVNDEIFQIAATRLNIAVEDGPTQGDNWQQTIKEVKSEQVEGKPRWEKLNEDYLSKALEDDEYKQKLLEADNRIAVAEKTKQGDLDALKQEVEKRKNDPTLIDALEMWGRSPNAKSDFGVDNNGYNAGIIHFFEYRSVSEKNGRYKNSTVPITIDGFIFYSNCYKNLLQNIDPIKNPDVVASVLLTDDLGQIRMQLITSNHEGIVAFRRADEIGAPKIITIIPGQNEEVMMKSINSELDGSNKSKKRLNKLNNGIVLVPISQYKNILS